MKEGHLQKWVNGEERESPAARSEKLVWEYFHGHSPFVDQRAVSIGFLPVGIGIENEGSKVWLDVCVYVYIYCV